MMARRPKLSKELISDVANYTASGLPVRAVCAMVGISETSFYRWLSQGRSLIESHQTGLQSDLVKQVEAASAQAQLLLASKYYKLITEPKVKTKAVYRMLCDTDTDDSGNQRKKYRWAKVEETVEKDGDGDWRGIAKYLATRFPDEWSETRRIELTGADRGPLQLSPLPLSDLSPETRKRILEDLNRAGLLSAQQGYTANNSARKQIPPSICQTANHLDFDDD